MCYDLMHGIYALPYASVQGSEMVSYPDRPLILFNDVRKALQRAPFVSYGQLDAAEKLINRAVCLFACICHTQTLGGSRQFGRTEPLLHATQDHSLCHLHPWI